MIKKKTECECCGKKYIKFFGPQKKCNNCSLYHKELVTKLRNTQYQLNKLRLRVYGVKNGTQRIQFKKEKKK